MPDYLNADDKTVAVLTPHGLRQVQKNAQKAMENPSICSFYIDVPRRDRLIKALQRGDDIEEAYRRNLSDVGQFDGITDEVSFVVSNKLINNEYKKPVDEITLEIILKYMSWKGR